ncbi:ABC transporter permease [Nocardioides sp. MAHUQ-72]|uniref:ABC transporter permease n=1 Tax=unclassified Nocardioides TaxID=2615069 RepID=UPI003612B2EB
MRELFGAPVDTLAVVLVASALLTFALVAALAVRRTVLLKLGVRNLTRRRGRSAIIVGGLMLGTMIIGSALGFGDIMANTVRTSVITSLGQTDEIVSARSGEAPDIATLGEAGAVRYLSAEEADTVITAARRLPSVDGVAPGISEPVAVRDTTSRTNEPRLTLFATDPAAMSGFGDVTGQDGGVVDLADLPDGEVYLDAEAADALDAARGDGIVVFLRTRQVPLTVRGVVRYDGTGTDQGALLMPISQAQRLLGVGDGVQHVLVSNDGDATSGADLTGEVTSQLEPTTAELGLRVEEAKADGLEQADKQGATFLSLFSTFGTFTITAGILLIFLVFVMLAAERRGEMGTARAIGTQRRHLVQMFLFEGAAYDVLAAAVGAVLGLGLSVVMVRLIAGALSESGLVTIRYRLTWTSLLVAFSLGALLTLAVVTIAAWRVSRLNIVAAVRNLPQPPRRRRRRYGWLLAAGCVALGALLVASAYSSKSAVALLVGGSLVLVALVPAIRSLGGSERLAYTVAGVGVLAWNLLPFSVYKDLVPDLQMGFDVFVIVGLLLVAGATWVLVYNLRPMLNAVMWVFGRSRRAVPVLKTAIASPLRNRFRTGATAGLFTLVVFTLVTGAATSGSFLAALDDEETFGGGYDITAQTSPLSPIPDMGAALAAAPGIDPRDITTWAGQSYVPMDARQAGDRSYVGYVVRGLDDSFLHTTTYGFATRAAGYSSDRAVWDALAKHPGLAVVDAFSVPRRANWGAGTVSDFQLHGFFFEDQSFAPVPVEVRDTQSGRTMRLKVIGVLADNVPYAMLGISTSQRTLAPLGAAAAPTVWYFGVRDGVDPVTEADRLEASFLDSGMQATAQSEALHDAVSASLTFQYLILGFLALGLVIGVAALGVISARSVVERRQQIGVLRAIGFQARMVQMSFLVESLLVTLVSVVVGSVLGLWVAFNVIQDSAGQPGYENLTLRPPWAALAVILVTVVVCSVLATWLPSVRASRVYPATALRYE